MIKDSDLEFFTRNAQKEKRARQIQDQLIAERKIHMNDVTIEILHEIIREAEQRAKEDNA
jgi:hypothetical protein